MKFKIGDRVKMNENSAIKGKIGYIVAIDDDEYARAPYLVEVPGWYGGHDGGGIRKDSDSCWWVNEDEIDLLESKSEQVGTAEVPTAEAENNTTDIMDAENLNVALWQPMKNSRQLSVNRMKPAKKLHRL